jgi:tetratricopeptide (TPR) repeat protein
LAAAAPHLRRALELCDEHGLQQRCAEVLNSLGELHLARREPEVAQFYLLRALDVAADQDERDSRATALHLLGRASLLVGDEESADRAFAAAVEVLRQLDLADRLRECAVEYADLLHRRGRLEESIVYWRIAAGAAASSPAVVSSEAPPAAAGSGA